MKNAGKEGITMFLLSLVLLARVSMSQGECSPSFTLPNILKDLVSLQYSDGSEQSYSYLFFSGMFSGPPVIAYSLSQLSIQQVSSGVSYYLNVQIQDMYIYFYYNSPNFRWSIVNVNFWITSRSDIVVSRNVLNSPRTGQTSSLTFPLNNTLAAIDAQSTHVLFIVGLYSTYNQNLTLKASPGALTTSTASVSVTIGAGVSVSNITLLSVIYNSNSGQFLSNSGTLSYKSFSSQYFNLYNNFMPIYYVLAGVNSFSITGANLALFDYKLDVINSTLLQSTSTSSFDQFGVSYLTLGTPTAAVCSPCNNFIYNGNCVDSCPSETYPFNFAAGGKACLVCDSLVGQMLNSLANGCSCIPGFELISANQCVSTSQSQSNCTGTNVIQNGTACICSPGTYNISGSCGVCPSGQTYQSGVCSNGAANQICPSHSTYSSSSGSCACDSGYMNISNVCTACQQGQYYDSSSSSCKCIGMNQILDGQGACECMSGYYSINSFCIACPTGTVYNGLSCVTANCSNNEVYLNGSCVCDSSSISLGSICVKCTSGTFADRVSNLCGACISNCLSCQNKVTCSQCIDGSVFDFSSLACMSTSPVSTPKLVSVKSGFPLYTLEGLVTDFLINSSSVVAKSRAELTKMVSVQFADLATIPIRTYYSQNPSQPNNIRISFYYEGLVPLGNFSVLFLFNDPSISLQENTTVAYQYSADKLQYKIS